MAPNRVGRIFFPTNPDLADVLGRTDLNFDIFFSFFGPRISGFPGPKNLDFPASKKSTWRRLEIWEFGDLGPKNEKENLKMQIRSAQNVGKVWISRKKILPTLFGAT